MTMPADIQLARSDSKANRILRFRLRYAERGWPIFPVWPEAGKVLGTTYAAARAGDIKTVRFGRLLRIPTPWLRQKLDLDESAS